jgi:hypothetical protein
VVAEFRSSEGSEDVGQQRQQPRVDVVARSLPESNEMIGGSFAGGQYARKKFSLFALNIDSRALLKVPSFRSEFAVAMLCALDAGWAPVFVVFFTDGKFNFVH